MLLPGHPGGVNWYEQKLWTAANHCDLKLQADFFTRAILGTHIYFLFFFIMTLVEDLSS